MTKEEKKDARQVKRAFIAMIKKHHQAIENLSLPTNETLTKLIKPKNQKQ